MQRGGYTLVEAIVALGILGAVLLAAQQVLAATVDARHRVTAGTRTAEDAQALLWAIAQDLRGATGGTGPVAPFAARAGVRPGDGRDMVSFVTTTDPRLRQDGAGPFLVAYRLDPSPDRPSSWDLLRGAGPWRGPEPTVLRYERVFRGVSLMRFRFWSGSRWQDGWAAEDGCPAAVALELAMQGPAGLESFATAVPLICGGPPAEADKR